MASQAHERLTMEKGTYLRVDEWYDTSLRDDDVAEELVQPEHAGRLSHPRRKNKQAQTHSSSFRMASCR